MHCADTSFLLSYYGRDLHTRMSRDYLAATHIPLRVHVLNDFEMANALRALKFRGLISHLQMSQWMSDYQTDLEEGILLKARLNLGATLRRANVLSERWTETMGNRSYDVFLVAAASVLGATHFCSFDARQRRLAEAEGMVALPAGFQRPAG